MVRGGRGGRGPQAPELRGVSSSLPEAVTAAIAASIGVADRPVVLHEPELGEAEERAVAACVASGWVSYGGDAVHRFECRLEELVGVPAAATASGTTALQLALQVAGVPTGAEVLTPSFTFAASGAAIVHAGAIPHFVDIEHDRLGVDAEALRNHLSAVCTPQAGGSVNRRTGRRIAALQVVHVFGHPCDLSALARVAEDYGLLLIEDAAEAVGSRLDDSHVGTRGIVGALSFNGNKVVTTGGGGAVISCDPDLIDRARHLSATAKIPHRWAFRHDAVGYNFRMPALNAALGVAQMDRLPDLLARKRALAARYAESFAGVQEARIVGEPPGASSNWWLNAVLLPDRPGLLEATLTHNHEAGFHTRPAWTPLHLLEPYREFPRADLPRTEEAARRVLNLPSSAFLGAAA